MRSLQRQPASSVPVQSLTASTVVKLLFATAQGEISRSRHHTHKGHRRHTACEAAYACDHISTLQKLARSSDGHFIWAVLVHTRRHCAMLRLVVFSWRSLRAHTLLRRHARAHCFMQMFNPSCLCAVARALLIDTCWLCCNQIQTRVSAEVSTVSHCMLLVLSCA